MSICRWALKGAIQSFFSSLLIDKYLYDGCLDVWDILESLMLESLMLEFHWWNCRETSQECPTNFCHTLLLWGKLQIFKDLISVFVKYTLGSAYFLSSFFLSFGLDDVESEWLLGVRHRKALAPNTLICEVYKQHETGFRAPKRLSIFHHPNHLCSSCRWIIQEKKTVWLLHMTRELCDSVCIFLRIFLLTVTIQKTSLILVQ